MLKTFRFSTTILVMTHVVPDLVWRAMDANGIQQVGWTFVLTGIIIAAVFAPFDEKDF